MPTSAELCQHVSFFYVHKKCSSSDISVSPTYVPPLVKFLILNQMETKYPTQGYPNVLSVLGSEEHQLTSEMWNDSERNMK